MGDRLIARQGDTLDDLLWRERALGPGTLDAVLAANPGLAALGPVVPIGTVVELPAAVTVAAGTPTLATVQLWD